MLTNHLVAWTPGVRQDQWQAHQALVSFREDNISENLQTLNLKLQRLYEHDGGLPCARVQVREPHKGTGQRCAEGVKLHWHDFGDILGNAYTEGYTYVTPN